MNTSASEGITPFLMGPGGGIVLGIDYSYLNFGSSLRISINPKYALSQ